MTMHHSTALRSLPRGLDLAQPGAIAQVVSTRSYRGELILFTSDVTMAGWSFHFVNVLRSIGYEHWLILADANATCEALHEMWRPMQVRHGESPLSCASSSYPGNHAGWQQWNVPRVFRLWAARWWVALQVLRRMVSVLSLDVDAALYRDVYPLLHGPPLAQHSVIITRNGDESESLNCGFVYFNVRPLLAGAAETGCPDETCAAACSDDTATRPAAEWVAQALWERFLLFLDLDRASLRKPPGSQVLWEQDAWNDVVKSLEVNRRVFPWAVGYGKQSDLWPRLGYRRIVAEVTGHLDQKRLQSERLEATHRSKRVGWRTSAAPVAPPWHAPREIGPEMARAEAFHVKHASQPLRWIPLCPPVQNASAPPHVPTANGQASLQGVPLTLGASPRGRLRSGSLAIAPIWLASLGSDPELGWAGASPSPFAYLHLTNNWRCFPKPCWSKAGRLFWLRANGLWDTRLDELGLTPRGQPSPPGARVLALPPEALAATLGMLQPRPRRSRPPSRSEEKLAFRRLHALLHNLATVAALLGRRPLIPSVPCEFVRAVQPHRPVPADRSRLGLLLPSVVQAGPAHAPKCHLAPAQYTQYASEQCWHDKVLHEFDLPRLLEAQSDPRPPNGSVALRTLPIGGPGRGGAYGQATMEMWRSVCRDGHQLRELPLLFLDGLLPQNVDSRTFSRSGLRRFDTLLDSDVSWREFRRTLGGKPKWPSTLQARAGPQPLC